VPFAVIAFFPFMLSTSYYHNILFHLLGNPEGKMKKSS